MVAGTVRRTDGTLLLGGGARRGRAVRINRRHSSAVREERLRGGRSGWPEDSKWLAADSPSEASGFRNASCCGGATTAMRAPNGMECGRATSRGIAPARPSWNCAETTQPRLDADAVASRDFAVVAMGAAGAPPCQNVSQYDSCSSTMRAASSARLLAERVRSRSGFPADSLVATANSAAALITSRSAVSQRHRYSR